MPHLLPLSYTFQMRRLLIGSSAGFLPRHSRSISQFRPCIQRSVGLLSSSAKCPTVQSRLHPPTLRPPPHIRAYSQQPVTMNGHGDLNNEHARREPIAIESDPAYRQVSLAITAEDDDPEVRKQYRPFLLSDAYAADDWIASLELGTVMKMVESEILEKKQDRLRILVLYGSLRSR